MKTFLMAAGAGALLVLAQTAVSAAYGPLDRAQATAKGDVAAPFASAAKSVNRPAMTFDAPYRPLDMASANSVLRSDEVTTPPPARETPVTDRVSGETGRYNLALSAYSQDESCHKQGKLAPNKVKNPGDLFYATCDSKKFEQPTVGPLPIGVLPLGIVAIAVVVADDGESD